MKSKNIIRIAYIVAAILLIPLLGNQFIEGWNWSLFDFVFAGVLLFGTGLLYEFLASKGGTTAYRAASGLALATAFLLVWINAAVGIIGDGDDGINLLYFSALALGFVGAIISRFSAVGMARTLFGVALGVMLIPSVLFFVSPNLFSANSGVLEVFSLHALFAALFSGAGLLYRQSTRTVSSLDA